MIQKITPYKSLLQELLIILWLLLVKYLEVGLGTAVLTLVRGFDLKHVANHLLKCTGGHCPCCCHGHGQRHFYYSLHFRAKPNFPEDFQLL